MNATIRLCRSIHMGRVVPELDSNLAQDIADKTVNVKKLATRRNMGMVRLPAQLELAAQNRLKCTADTEFRKEAKRLINIMHNLKLPDDNHTIDLKRADIKTELEIRDKIKSRPDYEPDTFKLREEHIKDSDELSRMIEGKLENRRRDWHYYEYDEHACDLYMATRLAPNYASLKTVMNEIRDLDPTYKPTSVLDFGSGLGTTIWAVNETWPKSVQEFMNVDLSKNQQSLCEYLLRGGKEYGTTLPGVYHRQYLPSSNKVKYDLVVAAFTMLEIPNMELRTHTIENLWHKTNDLLIIIERGNIGGFTVINEARHLILDMSGHDVTKKIHLSIGREPGIQQNLPDSHVFAPCPHEFACPKGAMAAKNRMNICRFPCVFEPLEIGERKGSLLRELFSYVVLRKHPHPSYYSNDQASLRWPRVVDKRSHSKGQITQKLCCPNGSLAETVITKKRYGSAAFDVAKSCDWGDTMPIKINDTYVKRMSFIDKKTEANNSETKSDDK